MKLSEEDIWRLTHIEQFIANVEECLRRGPKEDEIVQAALERFIGNIGEACRAVSEDLKNAYPDIPWNRIVSMRNAVVHEYYKIKRERVWDVAEHKIPALKDWIKGIMETHRKAGAQ